MRIRGGDDAQMTSAQACGATNSTWGEAEDYLVNIVPPSPHDPAITAIPCRRKLLQCKSEYDYFCYKLRF